MNNLKKNILFSLLFLFTLRVCAVEKYSEELPYDYTNTYSIPIEISIKKEISTKDALKYGEQLDFILNKDVVYNNKIIVAKNSLVKAKIASVVTSGMNGFPAEITIDDFDIPNINDSQLLSTYTKYGVNRSLWVYPLKWALTPIPLVGSLTNLIKGGHAKIKPSDVITLYYFPNWKKIENE